MEREIPQEISEQVSIDPAPEQTTERPESQARLEEVFSGGYRLTAEKSAADIPETWALETADGKLLVIDPGGETPADRPVDRYSTLVQLGRFAGTTAAQKLQTLESLMAERHYSVGAYLLTHGHSDHTNNIENVDRRLEPDGPVAPIYVGRTGWWSTLSPEKEFLAGRKNMEYKPRHAFSSQYPDHTDLTGGSAGDMIFRDVSLRALAATSWNPRHDVFSRRQDHAKKKLIADRLRSYDHSFELAHGRHLEVVPLPGHAMEEVGFYIPEEKILKVGDLLCTSKSSRADRMNMFLPDSNVYAGLASLDRMMAMDITKLYVAHGPPVLGQDNIRAYLERVRADAQAVIDKVQSMRAAYPHKNVHQLRNLVFTPDLRRADCRQTEEVSWIFSILRDAPEATHGLSH